MLFLGSDRKPNPVDKKMALKGPFLLCHYLLTRHMHRSLRHQRMHFAMGHFLILRKPRSALLTGKKLIKACAHVGVTVPSANPPEINS